MPDKQRDYIRDSRPLRYECLHTGVTCVMLTCIRGVAQPGSALAWGARGPRFESGRPDWPGQNISVPREGLLVQAFMRRPCPS